MNINDEITRRSFLAGTLSGLSGSSAFLNCFPTELVWLDAAAEGESSAVRQSLSDVSMRGYGRVRRRLISTSTGVKGLSAGCESAEKADLLLAKYLMDLAAVGLVEKAGGAKGKIPAYGVGGGRYVCAFRAGRETVILQSESREALAAEASAQAKGRTPVHTPQARVPAYLNRWDQHGFLFYYSTFMWPPESMRGSRPYDYSLDFEFAQKEAKSGLVFWNEESGVDSAEGMMNFPWWEWAAKEAQRRRMPFHINTSAAPTTWLLNRYRSETALKMPQYCGSFYRVADPWLGGGGILSWASEEGKDAELGLIQTSVKRHVKDPDLVGWLEPHGELGHGSQQLFLDCGPSPDKSFRAFLSRRFGSLEKLNARWGSSFKSWDDLHAPELADFLGWGPEAVDLRGLWKMKHEELAKGQEFDLDWWRTQHRRMIRTAPAPPEWLKPGFDDSSWGSILAPGHDQAMFLAKRPAVYRRSFTLPPSWDRSRKAWLYVWCLNWAEHDLTAAYLNGVKAGESEIPFFTPQWCAFEVTSLLAEGENSLALRLPNGYLGYRVYLSHHEPKHYPDLGPEMNARWVDYIDWTADLRFSGVRRGAEMIRQVDPDRPITFMSPDVYVDGIKGICEDYGGHFHDTGAMAAFWYDLFPMLARSSDLVFDLEPGSPAGSVREFKWFMGRYLTEGIQGISYFIHVGNVLWNDDIRREFMRTRPIIDLVGRHHIPKAETAVLYSQRCARILGYPWTPDPNRVMEGGYMKQNPGAVLLERCRRDGLVEADFFNGNASAYRVIIDSSTPIMEDDLVDRIEKHVREGGVFVAFGHTGRHRADRSESWPISRITGYDVVKVERRGPDGRVAAEDWQTLHAAPGQDVFSQSGWSEARATGLRMRPRESGCRDLLLWKDGTTAAGMRKLGKGWVIHVGVQFSGQGIPDRVDAGQESPEIAGLARLFSAILDWQKVEAIPATVGGLGAPILLRHSVSNNGLYDVWTLYNRMETKQSATLAFEKGFKPALHDVLLGREAALTERDGKLCLPDLQFDPYETRAFISPRKSDNAPEEWLSLLSKWWRTCRRAPDHRLPTSEQLQVSVRDLTEGWRFLPLAQSDPIEPCLAPGLDSSQWESRGLGIWGLGDHGDVKRAALRREFTVPREWSDGSVELWIQSWTDTTFMDAAKVYFDGELIHQGSSGVQGSSLGGRLKPGSRHVLVLDIESEGCLAGVRANAWIHHLPEPRHRISLAGKWTPSRDALHEGEPFALPGPWDALTARREVFVPESQAGRTAVFSMVGDSRLVGVIVNGSYVRRHHHGLGERTDLNITPWIRFGQTNEIMIAAWKDPCQGEVRSVELHFFDPGRA